MNGLRGRPVRRLTPLLGILVLTTAILSLVVASAAGAGTTRSVCSSGCSYSTIQAAIDAASDGDTIAVGAGTYTEQLTDTKSLTLVGAGAAQTVIAPVSLIPDAAGMRSIVRIGGSPSVSSEVSGFTIRGPVAALDAGVMVCDGATANIHDNAVRDIRESVALSGAQRGIAIRVGRQALAMTGNATIADNVITGYQKGGIVVDNAGSNAVISGNTVTGEGPTAVTAQNGIQVSRGATASISGNTISANNYTPGSNIGAGMLLYQPGSVTVGPNTVNGDEVGLWTDTQSVLGSIDLADLSGSGNGKSVV